MNEEPEEVDFVVSPEVYDSELNETPHVDGAEVKYCSECGHAVWVSPSSQPFLAKGFTLICMRCLQFNHGDKLKDADINVAPGAAAELLSYFEELRRSSGDN